MITLPSKIFIDGGDPAETREAKKLLGSIDGQTTNPTLISRNPDVRARLSKGEKYTEQEAYGMYRSVVSEISPIVEWSVSIETYADKNTTADAMYVQAKQMFTWIPNAWIKLPTTKAGLTAAERLVKEGVRVNMTLCFSQSQAAAVYAATRGTKEPCFVSPFVGRLDDRGEDGMQLIANILKMYRKGDGHMKVVSASVRTYNHFLYSLALKCDIITIPFKIFNEWAGKKFELPEKNWVYDPGKLKPIPYKNLALNKPWTSYDIQHDLTDIGIEKFAYDWNNLVK